MDVIISVDTTRAEVAKKAIEAGADLINDISGATFDSNMLSVILNLEVPIILMHIKGTPVNMQSMTNYQDLIKEVKDFLLERIEIALKLGIKKEHLIIDPGIGFAKNYEQNITILRNIASFKQLGYPVLIGTSRKRFIGQILQRPNQKIVFGVQQVVVVMRSFKVLTYSEFTMLLS